MITPSAAVLDNITRFLKLTPLCSDPKQSKWIRDENDLLEALDITNMCYHDTARMVGIPMYVGESSFDFTEDVKRAVEENLLHGRDPKDHLIHRKHNITMYHLVIEPIIDQLATLPHTEVLSHIDAYFESVATSLLTNPTDPHMDDAIVALEMVRATVRARDGIRKQQKLDRRTKKKSVVIDIPDDVDDSIDD